MKSKKLEALKLVAGAAAEFCAYEVAHGILKYAFKYKTKHGIIGKLVVGIGVVSIASAVGYFTGKAVEKQIDETVDAIEEMKEEVKKAREKAENESNSSENASKYVTVNVPIANNKTNANGVKIVDLEKHITTDWEKYIKATDDITVSTVHSNDLSNCKVNIT